MDKQGLRLKVVRLKRKGKALEAFRAREWARMDRQYYERGMRWRKNKLIFKAVENNKILGVLTGDIKAGVCCVSTVIVAARRRGEGVGRELMRAAEKAARSARAHKIYLITGKKWGLVPFYELLGYRVVAQLRKHYGKVDFVEMEKFL